jgi:hypothetical protein
MVSAESRYCRTKKCTRIEGEVVDMGMLGNGIKIERTMDGDQELFTVLYEKPKEQQRKGYMWNSATMTAEEFVKTIVSGGGTEADANATLDACRQHYGVTA